MSDWLELFLRFLVIFNPFGMALVWRRLTASLSNRQRAIALAPIEVAAFPLIAVAVFLGDEILDLLNITAPSMQIAAGVLVLVQATRQLLERDPFTVETVAIRRWPMPVLETRMILAGITPAALAVAIFYGADRSQGSTFLAVYSAFVGAAIGGLIGATALSERGRSRSVDIVLRELGRLLLVGLVVLAVDMVMDGVEAA